MKQSAPFYFGRIILFREIHISFSRVSFDSSPLKRISSLEALFFEYYSTYYQHSVLFLPGDNDNDKEKRGRRSNNTNNTTPVKKRSATSGTAPYPRELARSREIGDTGSVR